VTRGNDLSFRPGQPTAGSFGRRRQPPPGDAGQMPRCPGLAPSRIRRWCAHHGLSRCPRPGPGGMRYTARHRTIARLPLPGHRAVGMIPARPSPAPSPPWPGSDGLRRASPELRYGLAGLALAGCQCLLRQPLVPTGPQNHVRIFSNHAVLAGAPLRNRTVDLLLTMDNQPSADQAQHTGKTPSTWNS